MTTTIDNEAESAEQTERCRNCKYWFYKPTPSTDDEADGPEFGQCKRNPPLLLTLENTTYTGFPMIVGGEWCGEYNRK